MQLCRKNNKIDDVWLVLLQLLLVGTILGTLLTYLLRGLMCRATVEVGTKSVLITRCDTGYDLKCFFHLFLVTFCDKVT